MIDAMNYRYVEDSALYISVGDASRVHEWIRSEVRRRVPNAVCGVVIAGARANTWFVWGGNPAGNLSEGCAGPLMAWFEAYRMVRE